MNSKCYKHILVATDLVDDQAALLKKIVKLGMALGDDLSVIHAAEAFQVYGGYGMVINAGEIDEQIMDSAKKLMDRFVGEIKKFHPVTHVILEFGFAKDLILEKAKELGADLIVLGTHGRHGIFSATAAGVIHHAHCDVLTVKLKD